MKTMTAFPVALMAVLGAAGGAMAQDGDPAAGEAQFAVCATCHTGEPGALGPSLAGVVGREAASDPDFDNYTPALKESGKVWTEEALDEFLASPFTVVTGTAMVFPVADPQARADVIAYLKTLEAE